MNTNLKSLRGRIDLIKECYEVVNKTWIMEQIRDLEEQIRDLDVDLENLEDELREIKLRIERQNEEV